MALTSEFISAVRDRNLLRIRIMLKDSLLVDKQFNQFTEMRRYAEENGADFWMKKTEEFEKLPKESWNIDVMNLELTRLVNDFTKERLKYCQEIVKTIYSVSSAPTQFNSMQQRTPVTNSRQSLQSKSSRGSANNNDYDLIRKSVLKMNKILSHSKTTDGRIWLNEDIDTLLSLARQIEKACENVKGRRK